MQQEQDRGFSLSALGLGLVTASLAECFYSSAGAYGARSILLLGFLSTAGLAAAAGLFAALAEKFDLFSGQGFLPKLAGWGFFAWFALETGRTIAAAQIVCREHFGSNALIAVLPVLLLVSWQMNGSALDRSARAIWWLLAAGILACLAGLWDQMYWHRLFGAEDPSLWADGWPKILIYPEYFALPLLCQGKKVRRGALLPFWSYAVQAGYAFVLELVLGQAAGPDYSGLELLRAWALGYFSRLDALLLLLWLAAALWRICLLAFVLRTLWQRNSGMEKNACIRNQNKGAQT
ncbi:hypothetical protein [Faecalibacterium sp. An77]|uniref:hypothetical protein n=1 Tax=Faecalibacterium sp. An77 TaxID=1965655 RepID=UPI001FA93A2A|nr:hypothetical protein [Faecalibacterium sp. An77]